MVAESNFSLITVLASAEQASTAEASSVVLARSTQGEDGSTYRIAC